MLEVDVSHKKEYGENPSIIVEAPQLTTLFGAFSDFIDGYSVMTTNNHGLRLSLTKRQDNSVKAYNVNKQDKKKFVVTNIKFRKEDKWANAVKAIISAFQSYGYKLSGMNITVKGESAVADNVTLTAMIFSSLSAAINALYNLNLDSQSLMSICLSANDFSSFYKARKQDLIMLFAHLDDKLVFFDLNTFKYNTMDFPFYVDNEEKLKTILLSPSLPSTVLTPEFDEFRYDLLPISAYLKEHCPKGVKVRDLTQKDIRSLLSSFSEKDKRYASYVIEESQAAKNCYETLLKNDLNQFARLLNQGQKNIALKAELTCPEIDWIVRRGTESGCIVALMQVYVGIAGMMLSIVREGSDLRSFVKLDEYERIFGFRATERAYIPSLGLRVI